MKIGLRALLEAPTVTGLAAAVDAQRRGGDEIPPLVPRSGRLGERIPSPSPQEQMWQLETAADPPGLFNVTAQHWFSAPVDGEALRAALADITARHDTLRTSFRADEDGQFQSVEPSVAVDLDVCDLLPVPEAQRDAELQRRVAEQDAAPFDLSRAPLFRRLPLPGRSQPQPGGHHLRPPDLRRALGLHLPQRARRRLRGSCQRRGTGAASPRRPVRISPAGSATGSPRNASRPSSNTGRPSSRGCRRAPRCPSTGSLSVPAGT